MRSQPITLLAAALLAVAPSPALAKEYGVTGVPSPIAGAGLGYLVLAGGYYVVRRWHKQKTGEQPRQLSDEENTRDRETASWLVR